MITGLVGNGRILLTINEVGEWNELFYPYPGQFQHLREMRLGVFDVERARFSWMRPGEGYTLTQRSGNPGAAIESQWSSDGIDLRVSDRVHPDHDLIIRTVEVRSEYPKSLRLFAYHSLKIAESMYQDTAYIDPSGTSVVHYKRGYYFHFLSEPNFSRATCGQHTLRGLRGTYVDAEDGMLTEGHTVSHGAADSALQWDVSTSPERDTTVRLFVALGLGPDALGRVIREIRQRDPVRLEREVDDYWMTWIARHPPQIEDGLSEKVQRLYQASVLVLRHMTGANGSIIASPDTRALVIGGDSYNYCWMRDGGYVSKAMDEAGLYESAQKFLRYCQRCQTPGGYFVHRHFPDGAIGSTWHPPPFLQIDQTGTVVAAVWHHYKRRGNLEELLDYWPMVRSAADFMASFRDPESGLPRPSYDLWEETNAVHTYSTAVVVHALERAARIAEELGKDPSEWRRAGQEIRDAALKFLWNEELRRFHRRVNPNDDRLDASLLPALKLGLLDWKDPRSKDVVDQVEARLWKPSTGGVARYEGDEYYGTENPWIISTLWLAEARLQLGQPERARELIEWVANHATPTLLLPEQVDSLTAEPRSATPLTWSHSTFVDVVNKYSRAVSGTPPTEE
jgi:oligosaccharide amylase